MSFAATWMDLDVIILSKVSQKEKKIGLITSLMVLEGNKAIIYTLILIKVL